MPNVVDQWKFGGNCPNMDPFIGSKMSKMSKTSKGTSGPLKLLTVGSKRGSGRNNTGRITAFHRGGGSKQSYRRLDSFCEYRFDSLGSLPTFSSSLNGSEASTSTSTFSSSFTSRAAWNKKERFGRVVRLEYDPNRTGCIALVEWYSSYDDLYWCGGQSAAVGRWLLPPLFKEKAGRSYPMDKNYLSPAFSDQMLGSILKTPSSMSYILAMEGMAVGGWLYSTNSSRGMKGAGIAGQNKKIQSPSVSAIMPEFKDSSLLAKQSSVTSVDVLSIGGEGKTFTNVDVLGGGVAGWRASVSRDFWSQPGTRLPLSEMVIGSTVCNVDGRYLRSAGSSGQVLGKEEATATKDAYVVVRFASGVRQRFPGSCLASVGCVSNRNMMLGAKSSSSSSLSLSSSLSSSSSLSGNKAKTALKGANLGKSVLTKAGASRWRGRRPIVRGVAMNPVDHPHGGGEGRSSGGRPSVTPWGKFTKGQATRKKSKPALQKENSRKGGGKGGRKGG